MKKKLLALVSFFTPLFISSLAFAQDAGASNQWDMKTAIPIGAGLAIGLAAFGGALGQGRAAAAALEGIARNPHAAGKIFTPFIVGLALIESLVLYALLVSILLMTTFE